MLYRATHNICTYDVKGGSQAIKELEITRESDYKVSTKTCTVMSEDPEALLSVAEFAKLIPAAPATIRKWAYARIIPCIRIGYVIRIPRYRAMRALEERTNHELTELQNAS